MADCTNWQTFSEGTSSWDRYAECNQLPSVVSPIPDQTNIEGDTGTLETADAFDVGSGSVLVYSATGLPLGASIDQSTGVITYDLAAVDFYTVNVTLTTEYGSATDVFNWTVNAQPVGIPPTVINPLPDRINSVGESGSIPTSQAFDPGNGILLTYSATGLPPGASIDSSTGLITYSLVAEGPYNTTVTLSTEHGNASDQFSWQVDGEPVGVPPTLIAPLPDLFNTEGDVGSYSTAQYFDPGNGTNQTYSAIGLPSGATISANSGDIDYNLDTPGDSTVTVTLTTSEGSVSDQFLWSIDFIPIVTNRWGTETDGAWKTDTDGDWILEQQL